MTTSEALKNLWYSAASLLGFLGALVPVRIFFWPPEASASPYIEPGGFLIFLGILMFGYAAFCVWHYVFRSFYVVFLGSRRPPEPMACFLALVSSALPSASIIAVPMAFAIAFDLPDPLEPLPAFLVFVAIRYVGRFATMAVDCVQSECFCE